MANWNTRRLQYKAELERLGHPNASGLFASCTSDSCFLNAIRSQEAVNSANVYQARLDNASKAAGGVPVPMGVADVDDRHYRYVFGLSRDELKEASGLGFLFDTRGRGFVFNRLEVDNVVVQAFKHKSGFERQEGGDLGANFNKWSAGIKNILDGGGLAAMKLIRQQEMTKLSKPEENPVTSNAKIARVPGLAEPKPVEVPESKEVRDDKRERFKSGLQLVGVLFTGLGVVVAIVLATRRRK